MTPSSGRQRLEWIPTSRQLGASIQAARLAKHMSQSDLGGLVGLSQAAISQLEHCRWKRVRGSLIEVLAGVLGLDETTLRDAARSAGKQVPSALQEALLPMGSQPAAEQARLAAVIQSLIAWRYGADTANPGEQSGRGHPQQWQTGGLT